MVEYALSQEGAEELERARLALLEDFCDPHTARQLDATGVAEGWRCLDVGAGAGSATRLLAERVGHAGSVLAVEFEATPDSSRASGSLCGGVRRHNAHSFDRRARAQARYRHGLGRLLDLLARRRLVGEEGRR